MEVVLAGRTGQRLELGAEVVGDRHLLVGVGGREVEVVEVEQPRQLGDRVGVVVDTQVDCGVVVAAVAGPITYDEERGRLPSAAVAAGPVACGEGSEESALARLVDGLGPGGRHGLHDLGTGEDVALDGEAAALTRAAAHPARPVEALAPGVGGGVAVGVDDADLAVVAPLVLLE